MPNRRAVFVAVLALALLAGPAAAVCRACCPATDERPVVIMSMPACCGNCEPSVESAEDRPPATVKKTTNDKVVPALAKPIMSVPLDLSFQPIVLSAGLSDLHSPSPPAPLRL